MTREQLEAIGLQAKTTDGLLEAEMPLVSGQLINPMTRQYLTRAGFSVVGDRLLVVDPPELVGTDPIAVTPSLRTADIEMMLARALSENIFHIQKRSEQLASIGVQGEVDPVSLQLYAHLQSQEYIFTIGTDRHGNFRLVKAAHGDRELTTSSAIGFELNEFTDRTALERHLLSFYGASGTGEIKEPAADEALLTYEEVARHFGIQAALPPKSSVELIIDLRVNGASYRFVAARVRGREFRGLLVSPQGKVWADHFDVSRFEGVAPLVAHVLGVSADQVEIIPVRGQ